MLFGTRSKTSKKKPIAKTVPRVSRTSRKSKGVDVPRQVFDTMRSIESLSTAIEPELADGGDDMARQRPEKRRKLSAQFRRIMNGLYGIITGKKGRLALAFLVVIVGVYLTGSHTVVINTLKKITIGVDGKDGKVYQWEDIARAVKEYNYAAKFGEFLSYMKKDAQALGATIYSAENKARKGMSSVAGRMSEWTRSLSLPSSNNVYKRVSRLPGYGGVSRFAS